MKNANEQSRDLKGHPAFTAAGETIFTNKNLNYQMLDMYDGKTLAGVLGRKLLRRLRIRLGASPLVERTVMYNGVVVFDRNDLNGEGPTVGQDFVRALLELGFKRCANLYEFCSGPGYIGYSLLANGFCEHLTLADINPAAVEKARETAHFNGIEHLVNIYQSDVLEQMPATEHWDLVVSNPPHFLPSAATDTSIRAFDPDWNVHRRFYASVKRFMKPGGHIVMQENIKGSSVDLFRPMIEEGGGRVVTSREGIDVCGRSNGMYYLVSEW
jgi:SAM-dependent methyltransferase